MKDKKQIILFVLKILENESDKKHPLTQTAIANIISGVMSCDRKTVGRNIKFLIGAGYPIVKTSKGFYLENKRFSVEEKDFIIRCVMNSDERSQPEKESLVRRIEYVLGKIYRNI